MKTVETSRFVEQKQVTEMYEVAAKKNLSVGNWSTATLHFSIPKRISLKLEREELALVSQSWPRRACFCPAIGSRAVLSTGRLV
jgi:hypothetical protein